MQSVKYCLTYFMFNHLFVAETAVDNISDEPIYSHCQPAVDGKNAPQKSPTVKKTKKALRKQINKSSPLRDLGNRQCLFFKQTIHCKNKLMITVVTLNFMIILVLIQF